VQCITEPFLVYTGQNLKYYKDNVKVSVMATINLTRVEIERDEMVLKLNLSATKVMHLRASSIEEALKWAQVIGVAKQSIDSSSPRKLESASARTARKYKEQVSREAAKRVRMEKEASVKARDGEERRKEDAEKGELEKKRKDLEEARKGLDEKEETLKAAVVLTAAEKEKRREDMTERIRKEAYAQGQKEGQERVRQLAEAKAKQAEAEKAKRFPSGKRPEIISPARADQAGSPSSFQGYLEKETRHGAWQRRFFELTGR
jgi:hypothetical protein